MNFIEEKDEIRQHMNLVDNLIDRKKTKEFVYQNIFHEKFKYFLFVDESEFGGYIFEGIELYLASINEYDFFLNGLTKERHIVPYSFNKNKKIPYQNMKEEFESASPYAFFTGLNDVCLEYLYYTKTGNWCGWIDVLWEVGIFAFETEELVKKFLSSFDETLFKTPEEVVYKVWYRAKTTYIDAFLKNYASLSYIRGHRQHRGQVTTTT